MTAKKPDAMANLQARADAALAAAAARGQTNLFDSVEAPRPSAIEPTPAELATVAPERAGKREKLLPVRHVERDFFLCDMFDGSVALTSAAA
ncbi:MAG: hypothetical protein M3Y65_17050 [Pseudomonadota bacterium]|nr:hypothetical protein [Pseudomonadota bacterium]